ncbi:crossover junction endonuclease EME1 isoform X2 [Poeciliopsis prolifica]|uniref:crossover junction endonuclease EME1 isoform X2 n=1 Tax=Poeciliopsis prolifica TaxID=188132 RepID=UPI0024146365|nr:crossover junction endonuclease EME1 isoform X2 [Poeciliopsis prolifica]
MIDSPPREDLRSSSDSDEELPVFDFLQPHPSTDIASQRAPQKPEVNNFNGKAAAFSGSVLGNCGSADVMTISSDSDDDVPYVPLAQRLKLRQDSAVLTERNQKGSAESMHLLTLHKERRSTPEEADALPLRHLSASETGDASPTGTKATKRSAKEIRASREDALRRQQARERQQQDREALKQEQERQKAERRALAEAAKALRPEECIKHMVVAVDPALLQLEGGGTLLASVQALGCSCAIEKQPVPRSVTWARQAPSAQVHKTTPSLNDASRAPEPHVVMQMTVEDFVTLIHNYIREERHSGSACSPTLTSWVQEQQRRHPDKRLSLAVIGLESYFRARKSQSQKRLRAAVAGEEAGGGKEKKKQRNSQAEKLPEVSRVEVEEAAVHLQLHTGVSVHFFSTWKEFSDHITMTTRAVAEAPFKRAREQTGFSFYLESEWAGGQRVDKAGKGLLEAWKRQIQQFNRVSSDVAAAILAAYPSPQLLKKAYSQCRTENEKLSLLSDLLIRRGEGVTSTTRRVGPELSKRLFLLMHSRDPEQNLDASL